MGPAGPPGVFVDENTALVAAANIRVTLPGICADVTPVAMSRVGIDIPAIEVTDVNTQYKTYRPGSALYPDIMLGLPETCRAGASSWFAQFIAGTAVPKNVQLSLLEPISDDAFVSATIHDAVPVSYDPNGMVVTLRPRRIELLPVGAAENMKSPARYMDKVTHTYTIDGIVGVPPATFNASSISGGALQISADLLAKKFVSPLSARLHWPTGDLADWIMGMVVDEGARGSVSLTSPASATPCAYANVLVTRVTIVNPLLVSSTGHMPAVVDVTVRAENVTECVS